MGYSTDFEGELKFTNEMTTTQLGKLSQFLGADCRDHPEWNGVDLYGIDLELIDDFSGLKWNGTEKTYDLVGCINLIIRVMREDYPDFGLSGELRAQGEEIGDIWILTFDEQGNAIKRDVILEGKIITCPHCEGKFVLKSEE